jgi:hypothetical protein
MGKHLKVSRLSKTQTKRCIKEFLCITHTVRYNYILLINTVRIQLHISVLYVDHLQVETLNLQISYTRCVGHLCGRGGRGADEISLFQ